MEDIKTENLIFDLSCLQGQIGNLVLSLNGLEQQRLFDPAYKPLTDDGQTIEKKNFIHYLESIVQNFVSSTTPEDTPKINTGLSTYYISKYIFSALLTLNKYMHEPKYDNSFKIDGESLLGGVKPFNNYFSRDLFNIIKNNKYYLAKTVLDNNNKEIGATGFDKSSSNYIQFDTAKDMLNQTKFIDDDLIVKFDKQTGDSHQVIIPEELLTSKPNFADKMATLMVDLYKEYYFYEIIDIQKRLNNTSMAVTGLDACLRMLIQQARNHFTREIYNNNEDITNEFPMSNILEEINDIISNLDPTEINTINSLKIFDGNSANLGIYQFIEEKTHMMNTVGNAIHYGLEFVKRLQIMNKHIFNEKDETFDETFDETKCCKGIDEGVTMMSNLISNLSLLTGENGCTDYILNKFFSTNNLALKIEDLSDIYDKYMKMKKDNTDSNPFAQDENITDFNSTELSSLGITDALFECKFIQYDGAMKFDALCDTTKIETYTLFKDGKVARYETESHYRNYALTVIKLTLALGILYTFRLLQYYNTNLERRGKRKLRSNEENIIEKILNKPLPNSLTLTELNKIQRLKNVLADQLIHIKNKRDAAPGQTDVQLLPPNINGTIENDDSLYLCMESIMEIMNSQIEDSSAIKIDSSFITTAGHRLYPFTKSMLYQFDEYFSVKVGPNDFNKDFNASNSRISFDLLTNALNYVAQGIVVSSNNEDNKYTMGDYEKMLTKIIYLCNCQTVNWSHLDKLTSTGLDDLKNEESPLFDLGLFVEKTDLFKGIDYVIPIGNTNQKFKTTFLTFIQKEMKTMLKSSNLTNMVKYVYWLTLYCINSYFIHLKEFSPFNVVVPTKQ